MHALENRTQRNYESSEGGAIFVTQYSTEITGVEFYSSSWTRRREIFATRTRSARSASRTRTPCSATSRGPTRPRKSWTRTGSLELGTSGTTTKMVTSSSSTGWRSSSSKQSDTVLPLCQRSPWFESLQKGHFRIEPYTCYIITVKKLFKIAFFAQ